VDAIVKAATESAPRPRYRVGWKAVLGAWGKRLLSARTFERLLRREFQLEA
jgi:hypothetical protein